MCRIRWATSMLKMKVVGPLISYERSQPSLYLIVMGVLFAQRSPPHLSEATGEITAILQRLLQSTRRSVTTATVVPAKPPTHPATAPRTRATNARNAPAETTLVAVCAASNA